MYEDHFVTVQSAAPGGTPTPCFVPFFTFDGHCPRNVNELPPLILGEGAGFLLQDAARTSHGVKPSGAVVKTQDDVHLPTQYEAHPTSSQKQSPHRRTTEAHF
jgi:hypothetical protein